MSGLQEVKVDFDGDVDRDWLTSLNAGVELPFFESFDGRSILFSAETAHDFASRWSAVPGDDCTQLHGAFHVGFFGGGGELGFDVMGQLGRGNVTAGFIDGFRTALFGRVR